MKRRLALVAATLAAACGPAEEAPAPPVFSAFSDPTQIMLVEAGVPFRIALQSGQTSTGYHWVLVDSVRMGPIRAVASEYRVPGESRDRTGVGGVETWTFNAPAAGTGTISLVFVRPGEKTVPRDTTRFRVAVQE